MRAFLLLLLLAVTAPAFAAPRLSHIYPAGGQRGTTVKLTFSGGELKDISGFYTTGTGLTAKIDPGGDAASRTVAITVAPDAPLGIQQIRVYDGTGLSNPRYFRVGQWPEQVEAEPNDSPKEALKVDLPVTVNGRIQQGTDRDGVTFHAKPGETVVCEVEGLRVLGQVGNSWLKGYMEIQDADGNVLAESQGTPDDYYRWDPVIAFEPPKAGDYTVFYRDLNWRGAAMAVYRLTVGTVPHAVGIFPLGGQRGASCEIHFDGPNLAGAAQKITIPADAPDNLDVAFTGPQGATNLRPFHVSALPDAVQNTKNQTHESAQMVPFPCVVSGRLAVDGSRDYYRFRLEKPQKVVLEVFSRRVGTPMDAEIILFDRNGKLLQVNDDARGRDCRIEHDLPAGDYVIRVRDIDDRGGPAFPYRLVLSPPQPAFDLLATPDAPKLARGANVSLTVKVERRDGFDGDVTVIVSGLPPGVTAAPLTIAKDKKEGALTLTATADAAPGPLRLSIRGAGTANGQKISVTARAIETYNIQGTAFQRGLIGPILLITEK